MGLAFAFASALCNGANDVTFSGSGSLIDAAQTMAGAASIWTPITASATCQAWYRGDASYSGGTWADGSGKGHNATQATAGKRPTYGATSGPNSTPALTFVAANSQNLQAVFTLAQPTWIWCVAQFSGTYVANQYIYDAVNGGNGMSLFRQASATMSIDGGFVLQWTSATPQSWTAYGCYFHGNSSYIQANGTTVASGAIGNGNEGGITIGSYETGLDFAGMVLAELVIYSTLPSATDLANLNAYRLARYAF